MGETVHIYSFRFDRRLYEEELNSFRFDRRLYEEELRRKAAKERPLHSGDPNQRPLSGAGPIESGKSRSIDLLESGKGGGSGRL